MALRRMAGAVVMVGFRGLTAEPGTTIHGQLEYLNLGGVILFDEDISKEEKGRNIVGPNQLAELTAGLHQAANQLLLIAIDQEGGAVARLNPSNGFAPFPPHAEVGERFEPAETRLITTQMARGLKRAGINVNFAPVVDLNLNPHNPIIGELGRSFSERAEVVIAHARAFLEGHHESGLACALKHFPGHGSAAADTHFDTADVTATFQDEELAPYRSLCSETDLMMVGHIVHRGFDEALPASLSRQMIQLLRDQIGFDGVVVTDCLEMAAVADHYSLRQRVSLALNAGVDLLLFGNNTDYAPDKPEQVVQAVVAAVKSGEVTMDCLHEHVERLSRLRWRLADTESRPPAPDPHRPDTA